MDDARIRDLIAARIAKRNQGSRSIVDELTAEWFPEERAFFDDQSQLSAATCGRRAGKTRGIIRNHLRGLLTIPGYRGLYLNSTRLEAERLAWIGNRGDGFKSLADRMQLPLVFDNSDLTIRNPANDGWMYLRGADDESGLRKALGSAYHEVTWDEMQKIPSKLSLSIREVFFPTLLDFGGKFRGTGTPSRQMTGIAWDVTRPEKDKRTPGWSVHHWTLLENPFFGRAKLRGGSPFVVWGADDKVVSGPHATGELEAAVMGCRYTKGIIALQTLYGGPEVAPIDSPIMQREAFGKWVREDAAYVYSVHKVDAKRLLYAPARVREDGFPDILVALKDLPFRWQDGLFALGIDIGWYPDPFAFVLWAWHGSDPKLYEVASWRKNYLTSDEQNDCIKAVREVVRVGMVVADASGPSKPAVKGWSKEWVERYQTPILEADKQHKYGAQDTVNNDILQGYLQLREDGVLYDEMSQLQWSSVVNASGKLVEDPTLANDACDAGLYAHRHSYAFRWRPEAKVPKSGSPDALLREEHELTESAESDDSEGDDYSRFH